MLTYPQQIASVSGPASMVGFGSAVSPDLACEDAVARLVVRMLFTPCAVSDSLLEALSQAVKGLACGVAVRFSPAGSCFDHSQNDPHRGELLRCTVTRSTRPMGCGVQSLKHKIVNLRRAKTAAQLTGMENN